MKKIITTILVSIIWTMPSLVLAIEEKIIPGVRDVGTSVPADVGVSAVPTVVPTAVPATVTTTIPSPTPRPKPVTPVSVPTPTTIDEIISTESNTTLPKDWFNIYVLTFFGVGGAVVLFYGTLKLSKSKNNKNEKDPDEKCGSIRELLEKKKKELEEMIHNWPAEKIKGMAQEKVLRELKKDETFKKIINTADSVKEKYNKLKETIEILEKRYDLCVLSIPGNESTSYQGTIIENSLSDKAILNKIEVTKNYHLKDWVLNDVQVNEKQIEKLGQFLNDGPWYMHFWQHGKDDVTVVFKDKNFKIKYSDKNTWTEAIEYGKSKGISEEQLDFKIQ